MMKRWLICCICLLVCPAFALAAVPDDVLHNAVMTLTWPDDGGECWVEGHVVLGERVRATSTEVYAHVFYQNYGFMDGVFTDAGGGSIHPATLVFEHTADGYCLQEIIMPRDGTEYGPSIRAMMPESCIRKMDAEGAANRAEMQRQMTEQAQNYLDRIGRMEAIQDWRERNLKISGMMTAAANFLSAVDRNYPLWVTSHERLENGVRYVYTREWEPYEANGETGVETMTKTRYDDGCVIETIIAEVEYDSLTVTLKDEKGSLSYVFAFDGKDYHQPVFTSVGSCGVDPSGIEEDIAWVKREAEDKDQ